MNVEFCEDNSGRSRKMHHFRKNRGEEGGGGGSATGIHQLINNKNIIYLSCNIARHV